MSRFVTRYFGGAVVVGLMVGAGLGAGSGDSATPWLSQEGNRASVISSNTELVALPVNVTDARGNFIADLKADNFRVFENGQLQNISFFEQEGTPVTVGLIVDHSGSMGDKLPEVAGAVLAFAHSSNPDDEMFVVDFDDNVSAELLDGEPFTSDAQKLEKAVTAVSARGQTALYDAIVEGLVHLTLGHWNRKALIVVSDGGDNVSQNKFPRVLEMARSSHAVIYAIGLLSESGQQENPGILRRLCRDTGGIAFFPPSGASIESVSMQIARDLRRQYMLGYAPRKNSSGDAFRRIEVKVSVPGRSKVHVRSRSGYSVGGAVQPAESGRSAP